jgi:hypothetical protein
LIHTVKEKQRNAVCSDESIHTVKEKQRNAGWGIDFYMLGLALRIDGKKGMKIF